MSFSIVVPIKNQFKIVAMCLDSLFMNYSDKDIILIDDGSTEENILKMLESSKELSNVRVFSNKTSFGHSFACTAGIESSKNNVVFLLNSDTIVPKGSLDKLFDVLKDQKIAVVGPSTSSATGPQMIQDAFKNRFVWNREAIEKYSEELSFQEQRIVDIDLVNGFCFGIKKNVFHEVGGFDPRLESYGNEKELLIRIRKSGYRTVWVSNIYTHHFGKMSYVHEPINISRAQQDADRYILQKHGTLA